MDILHVNEELRMAAHEINGAVSATISGVVVPPVDGEIYLARLIYREVFR